MKEKSKIEIQLGEDERREIARFAATCARRVLPIFEAAYPNDQRPRDAIAEAEAFAAGDKRTATLRARAWAAYAAARETKDAAAANAAHAASHAAAAAYLHPLATPHQVKHVLGAAAHQALVLELEAGNDIAVGKEQLHWATNLASPAVRDVLRRLPLPPHGRGRFSELLNELDAQLRD
ncbi:putative immunity protein [Lysobacter antibioticus]|uniref:Putative exonuclease SbcC n=1 Tax=Lysobacter antibioticus TaxID=84531 RepID=A0A0S2FDP4_LYSAN|nr:Imm5 family immunity protein [Lysobacter antibioticus]ALN81642.1 putative exonuclease SbcC [Lysobacter antibioticus]